MWQVLFMQTNPIINPISIYQSIALKYEKRDELCDLSCKPQNLGCLWSGGCCHHWIRNFQFSSCSFSPLFIKLFVYSLSLVISVTMQLGCNPQTKAHFWGAVLWAPRPSPSALAGKVKPAKIPANPDCWTSVLYSKERVKSCMANCSCCCVSEFWVHRGYGGGNTGINKCWIWSKQDVFVFWHFNPVESNFLLLHLVREGDLILVFWVMKAKYCYPCVFSCMQICINLC